MPCDCENGWVPSELGGSVPCPAGCRPNLGVLDLREMPPAISDDQLESRVAHFKALHLMPETTILRPAAMSYVKPAEYRKWAELLVQDLFEQLTQARADLKVLVDGVAEILGVVNDSDGPRNLHATANDTWEELYAAGVLDGFDAACDVGQRLDDQGVV